MGSRPLIVLQARMASQRLPGKALATIGGRPIVARCLTRLRLSGVAPVVLATTERPEDDVLAAVASDMGVPVVRGPDADVLKRFVMTARRFDATHVIRATADNPAVDVGAPGRVLDVLRRSGADYVVEAELPYGAAVEAVSTDALELADRMATMPADREHVTPLVRRDRLFAAIQALAPPELRRPGIRVTVDTLQDLMAMRHLMHELGDPEEEPHLSAIIAAADAVAQRQATPRLVG